MDRSLYPEGVEVHQRDLERTENTKAFHIIQRHDDVSEYGVVTGSVTVNTTDGTTVDVSSSSGYTPNGEFIEAAAVQGLELADYTLGAINYVLSIYRENDVEPQPHETNGESYPTSAERSAEIKVLTQSEYSALPTSDNNLINDAYDRALVIAKVTGRGIGVSITSGDITNSTTFTSAITISRTNNVTGVEIINIDSTTNTGNGTLSFTLSTSELTWQAPGDTAPGAAVAVLISGTYVITSSSGKTITCNVIVSNLPGSNQSDTITITNVYSQSISRHTATDLHHRSLIGSGVPSIRNPHGLTLEDLSGSSGSIEAHQDLMHSNGILKISNPNVLLATVNTATTPDLLTVVPPTTVDLFYMNGIKHEQLVSANVLFNDVVADAQAVFDIYAVEGTGGIASLEKRERFRYTTTPPPSLSTVVQIIDASLDLPATASARIFFDDSENELRFDSGTGSYGPPESIPTTGAATRRLFDVNQQYFIDVNVDDITNWGGIDGGGDKTEYLTVYSLPTDLELEERLRIAAVVYSGSTGFLGYGFGSGNSPNNVLDRRYFGTTGLDVMRDDVGVWEEIPASSPRSIVKSGWVGISDVDTWKNPIRAIHIYASNGYAEQVWESGTIAYSTLGRTWRWATDPSGNFKAIRSKSGLRGPAPSLTLDNAGRCAINTTATPTSALYVNGISNETAAKIIAGGNAVGLEVQGGPSGGTAGIFTANGSGGRGLEAYGNGNGAGLRAEGGTNAYGIYAQAGSGGASGIYSNGVLAGHGIHARSVGGGYTGHGVYGESTGTGGCGVRGDSNTSDPGVAGYNNSGYGVYGESAVVGVYGKGLGVGPGGQFSGGGTSGNGITAAGGGTGHGLDVSSPGAGHAITAVASGSGYGIQTEGNSTRSALRLVPRSTLPSSGQTGDLQSFNSEELQYYEATYGGWRKVVTAHNKSGAIYGSPLNAVVYSGTVTFNYATGVCNLGNNNPTVIIPFFFPQDGYTDVSQVQVSMDNGTGTGSVTISWYYKGWADSSATQVATFSSSTNGDVIMGMLAGHVIGAGEICWLRVTNGRTVAAVIKGIRILMDNLLPVGYNNYNF